MTLKQLTQDGRESIALKDLLNSAATADAERKVREREIAKLMPRWEFMEYIENVTAAEGDH